MTSPVSLATRTQSGEMKHAPYATHSMNNPTSCASVIGNLSWFAMARVRKRGSDELNGGRELEPLPGFAGKH